VPQRLLSEARASVFADDQRLPALFVGYSFEGDALCPLHFGIEVRVKDSLGIARKIHGD